MVYSDITDITSDRFPLKTCKLGKIFDWFVNKITKPHYLVGYTFHVPLDRANTLYYLYSEQSTLVFLPFHF